MRAALTASLRPTSNPATGDQGSSLVDRNWRLARTGDGTYPEANLWQAAVTFAAIDEGSPPYRHPADPKRPGTNHGQRRWLRPT
jgi:hypothetical protein